MASLKNHKGKTLRSDAAQAFNRAEDDHGIFVVNSAARTEASQQVLINRWDRGGRANRPPFLYPPARPASSSNHVKFGGIAIDIGDWRRFAAIAAQYGFSHPYPSGDPVHFEFVGKATPKTDTVTKDRQQFLNSRGWSLVEDGIEGPLTKKAYKQYQTYLKNRGWYTDKIDGIWGPNTQKAHAIFFAEISKPKPKPKPKPTTNPFGLSSVTGLQKVANLYGANTAIDDIWGPKSAKGFSEFLRKNWGYIGNDVLGPVMWRAIARWLRARYGYVGNNTPGPIMRSALFRAHAANQRAL